MATDSGRGNPIAADIDPGKTVAPPPVNPDTKKAVQDAASNVHAEGQDAGAAPAGAKVKTAKEIERDRKKAEKQAKFEEKKAAQAAAAAKAAAAPKKEKAKPKKEEEEPLPPYVNDTPAGEKKRLRPLDDPHCKAYNPVAVEAAWYEWWEKEGFFKPEFQKNGDVKPQGYFVISHPPPNVTGFLHMGHALGDSIQDCMVRFNRMKGKTALWVPGCDHAGIATQSVVENMLWRREGKTRHDLGREKFIERVWEWKSEYHTNINQALRKLGGSFDWSRERFTMDETLTRAVQETFVKWHEEGVIYRANRLVNWCCKLTTALSNLEVVNKELTGRTLMDVPGYDRKVEFGVIHYFKYPIDGSDKFVEVATTRIETMLGDTAIAVHPDDARYKDLVGKSAKHPFIEGRLLRIVADSYVDPEFGSGAVKITPAHDPNDYAIGERHKLEFINILTDDGLLNENAGPYAGQRRFDVRYTLVEDLKKLGLYVDKKDNPMTVPVCERSKDIIEPMLKPQWWVSMKDMAADAVKALDEDKFKIKPDAGDKSFRRWMTDINDWCISRQLWWGHRCPVYFAEIEGGQGDLPESSLWFAAISEEEARKKAEAALPGKKFTLRQDEDVLDTWFSSGLWPFSTLGWPANTDDFNKLFPTSVLETGWDIIFFWVARMIMMSLKLTGKVPFYEVFLHPLVRDSEGRKMSKSLGNVVNPLDVIAGIGLEDLHAQLAKGNLPANEIDRAKKYQKTAFPNGIPECGADGLRLALLAYMSSGDIHLDIKVVHGYRKFCNKIWQASKFVLGNLDAQKDFVPRKTRSLSGNESLAEKWILHKMNKAVKSINKDLEERDFFRASLTLYQFWYSELCDVFIENSKAIITKGNDSQKESALQTLYSVLDTALTLSHPFLPYITEELWQRLPRRPGDETRSIVIAAYPLEDAAFDDPSAETAYDLVSACAGGARSLMAESAIKTEARVFVKSTDATSHKTLQGEITAVQALAGKGLASLELLASDAPRPSGCVAFSVNASTSVYLHVKGRVDEAAEIAKANGKLTKAKGNVAKQQKILADPAYLEKVAEATQEADRKKLADFESEASHLEDTIKQLEALKLES